MSVNKVDEKKGGAKVDLAGLARFAPGLALAAAVAVASVLLEPFTTRASMATLGRPVTITAPVIALVIGMILHTVAARPSFTPGLTFSVKKLLRWAIALFGLKIALSDILALGLGTALMVIVSMAVTLASGVVFARLFGRDELYGAIAGGATAVCGASAALATASVLPAYRERESDTAFVVITVNLLATVAMVFYPLACAALGFDERATGVFLGASIHDVAQVVGAGYAVSDSAGNTATVVKLFRVFLLLPVVTGVGWYFASRGADAHKSKVPVPVFAIMFVVFVIVNTLGILPVAIKTILIEMSRWGLLIAIAALGLNTSIRSVFGVGPRHLLIVLCATAVIFVIPLAWLALAR